MRRRVDEAIDGRHDLIAALDRESAAGAEVVLQIDNDQGVVRHCLSQSGRAASAINKSIWITMVQVGST
jgi:hypothetical protein